jgi:hypothetical protein
MRPQASIYLLLHKLATEKRFDDYLLLIQDSATIVKVYGKRFDATARPRSRPRFPSVNARPDPRVAVTPRGRIR